MTADKRVQATSELLEHVGRAREALKEFHSTGVKVQGVLANPRLRAATLKWAEEPAPTSTRWEGSTGPSAPTAESSSDG